MTGYMDDDRLTGEPDRPPSQQASLGREAILGIAGSGNRWVRAEGADAHRRAELRAILGADLCDRIERYAITRNVSLRQCYEQAFAGWVPPREEP